MTHSAGSALPHLLLEKSVGQKVGRECGDWQVGGQRGRSRHLRCWMKRMRSGRRELGRAGGSEGGRTILTILSSLALPSGFKLTVSLISRNRSRNPATPL